MTSRILSALSEKQCCATSEDVEKVVKSEMNKLRFRMDDGLVKLQNRIAKQANRTTSMETTKLMVSAQY